MNSYIIIAQNCNTEQVDEATAEIADDIVPNQEIMDRNKKSRTHDFIFTNGNVAFAPVSKNLFNISYTTNVSKVEDYGTPFTESMNQDEANLYNFIKMNINQDAKQQRQKKPTTDFLKYRNHFDDYYRKYLEYLPNDGIPMGTIQQQMQNDGLDDKPVTCIENEIYMDVKCKIYYYEENMELKNNKIDELPILLNITCPRFVFFFVLLEYV